MFHFDLNLAIVFVYLAMTLIVGIYTGRNIKTMKEYAVGDKSFSISTLTATATATWIGAGALIGVHEKVYQYGIVWLVIFLSAVIEILIFKRMAPGILKFKGLLSAAEILGAWYGKKARVIGGLCIAIYSIGIIGTQVAAIGYLFKEFLGIDQSVGIYIGAGIVILYSSFGGIKSVTYTDVIQFAFFVVAMPLIASVMLDKVGGYEAMFARLPAEHLKLFPNYGSKAEYITMFLFFLIPFCDACLIQRVLMSDNKQQVIRSFSNTSLVMGLFYILCAQIALCAYAIDPKLDPNTLIYHVVNAYLPMGIKGIGIAGLLAVVMSTADSYINVSSVAIINDVIKPLRTKDLSLKTELLIAKIASLFIGLFAIYFSTTSDSIITLMIHTWMVWAPIVVVPLYGAMLGIRSNFKIFAFSALSGISLVIIWQIFDIEKLTGINNSVPAVALNGLVFSTMTYYYNRFKPDELMGYKTINVS